MRTNFNGHSGCRVYYQDGAVVKQAVDYPLDRLHKQIEIHKWFYYANRDVRIRIPKILDVSDDRYSMEFIPSVNTFDFLSSITTDQIELILKTLNGFVNRHTTDEIQDVTAVVEDKFYSIQQQLNLRWLDFEFQKHYAAITVPVGRCHGDLTIDNILCIPNSGCLGLIDFLDSYIESPIMDLVKLKQDTKYGWVMFKNGLDSSKIRITLDYLDKYIPEQPAILELMNLARILPYGNDNTRRFIKDKICQL